MKGIQYVTLWHLQVPEKLKPWNLAPKLKMVLEYINLLFSSQAETVKRLFTDVFFCVVNSFPTGTVVDATVE